MSPRAGGVSGSQNLNPISYLYGFNKKNNFGFIRVVIYDKLFTPTLNEGKYMHFKNRFFT